MDVGTFEVTSYRIQKPFEGFVATFEHDALEMVHDAVVVKVDAYPETVFAERVDTLLEKKVIEGKRLSFATFTMCPTGEKLDASPELLKWVDDIKAVLKANQIKFTQVVQ